MPSHDREFDPTTWAEFETHLKRLVSAAHENHIDVEGGIDVRHPSTDVPDWTVEITRIKKDYEGYTVGGECFDGRHRNPEDGDRSDGTDDQRSSTR